jgi:hypothetical protein
MIMARSAKTGAHLQINVLAKRHHYAVKPFHITGLPMDNIAIW